MWSDPSSTAVVFVKSLSLASRLKCVLLSFDSDWSFIVTQCDAVARIASITNAGALTFTDHAPRSPEVAGFDPGLTVFIAGRLGNSLPGDDRWNIIQRTDINRASVALSQLLIDFWFHGSLEKPDQSALPLPDMLMNLGAHLYEALYLCDREVPYIHGGHLPAKRTVNRPPQGRRHSAASRGRRDRLPPSRSS